MKKAEALSLILAIALLITGCEPKLPYVINMHYAAVIEEGNSIMINSAELGDGYLNVEVELDFTTLSLNDFDEISVRKWVYNSSEIMCSVEKTKELNGEEKFNEAYSGKVILCFEDSSINSGDENSEDNGNVEYEINFLRVWSNGIGKEFTFLIDEFE